MGRGASFLLNLPPDRRGRVHETDERSLRGFRELLDATFGTDLARGARASASNVRGADSRFAAANVLDGRRDTYWATDDEGVTTPELVLDLGRAVTFNVVSLREHLPLGQRVEDWALDRWTGGAWREFARGTAIGSRRLWRGGDVTTERVRLRITKAPACSRDLGARPPPRAAGGAGACVRPGRDIAVAHPRPCARASPPDSPSSPPSCSPRSPSRPTAGPSGRTTSSPSRTSPTRA